MYPRVSIQKQMNALRNPKIDGISIAYQFASTNNKKNTGPLSRFKSMVKQYYEPLLNNELWYFNSKGIYSKNKQIYERVVSVLQKEMIYTYKFVLSYSKKMKQWKTDSVIFMDKMKRAFNVKNTSLKMCSLNPRTGYHRDGYCNTDTYDKGTHTVCAKMTRKFLNYSKRKGNDLITPSPENNFPGLKPGDKWCLCSNRYKEAFLDNVKVHVYKKATHKKTLKYMSLKDLS